MKIGIWGSLNYGNFGDDVMNVMFALELKRLGCIPILYRLDEKLAKQYGLITVTNLDDLLKDVVFSFIGGGSWLESRPLGVSYEKDFEDYLSKLNQYKKPFYAISIGGDSIVKIEALTKDRINLFSSTLFKGGTVRLKSSLELMKKFNKNVELYPDVVLKSSEYFLRESTNTTSKKFRIGISLNSFNSRLFNYMLKIIRFTPFIYNNYELIFLNTHLEDYNLKYEASVTNELSKKISNYQYKNLEDFYSLLNSLDCIISSKLHPGVASLSCNVPFIWIPGYDKTRTFLKSVDLNKYEYSLSKVVNEILMKKIVKIKRDYNFELTLKHRELAEGHINYIFKLIEKYR